MKEHKLLWTGGWDSTFRLLDLVINKRRTVQPYYILDQGRQSTEMEKRTMEEIKGMIVEMNPESKNRILPTIEIQKSAIPLNNRITQAYNHLFKISFFGTQYDWLSRFADKEGLSELELSIHADDTATVHIIDKVEKVKESNDTFYRLKEGMSNTDYFIFTYYHYPLLKETKLDMERVSKKSGFIHIMEKTWFCHTPINNQPCGMCNPCKYTRGEGLGRRVPNPPLRLLLMRKTKQIAKRVMGKK